MHNWQQLQVTKRSAIQFKTDFSPAAVCDQQGVHTSKVQIVGRVPGPAVSAELMFTCHRHGAVRWRDGACANITLRT